MDNMCMKQNLEADILKRDMEAYWVDQNGDLMCHSVHGKSRVRLNKAKLESKKPVVPISEIISYVNELLVMLGIKEVENPIMRLEDMNYAEMKEKYSLEDEKDIIWLKFTADGYLGVVAQGNDINFDCPLTEDDYHKKGAEGRWLHTTSGILIHSLGKRWDTGFVLVFPLSKEEGCVHDRYEIETAVGNYLVKKGVPILDYYSHNY